MISTFYLYPLSFFLCFLFKTLALKKPDFVSVSLVFRQMRENYHLRSMMAIYGKYLLVVAFAVRIQHKWMEKESSADIFT